MQRIIKNGEVIDERWHLLPLDASLDGISNSDDLIVPLRLWLESSHALKVRDGGLGVWLQSHEQIEEIVDDLQYFQVIALDFPAFTDGRHFSSARLLRERYGYTGEIRAIGDVLRDQLFFMQRCGFDAFAVRPDRDPYDALKGLSDFSVTYQTGVDQPLPLFRRR
ncbi:DUF934 domain-containing protein [Pseudomonas stutzeri]|nr:DUF934 domain-containing protein [Stutzerimonas stutzeri]